MPKLIKQKRKERGYTRKQLSERLGVHEQVIVRWEETNPTRKIQVPTLHEAESINQVLKISYKDLLNDYREVIE
jgi:transcriptional regulator with XRE-family HTH domain